MKKVAVFTSHVYEPMSGLMQKGIKAAALEHNVKVIFFASFSDSYSSKNYGEYSRYDEGDNVSFDIPDLNDFDGIIKISTYFSETVKKHLDQILSNVSIPVINIGGMDERYMSICCDETRSFSEVVEHLIKCHNCRDIYHLAGIKDKNFTFERVEAYKTVLLKNNIPFDEEKIYYGNLWRDCGEAALDYILGHCHKNGKEFPDAVVCANDYSAVGLINACKARGIRVPEDIKVTGYDGISDALNGFPSITTSRQPFYNSGYQAIVSLVRSFNGEELPREYRIMGEFLKNQSCGCKEKTVDNIDDIRDIYLKRLRNTTSIAQSTTNLMLSVSNAKTLEDCFREVCENAKTDTGFKEMLLCLAPDWDKQRIVGESYSNVDEEMTVVTGYREDKPVPYQTFRKKDILPKDMLEDPYPYYIFTIHHLQYYMGYLIVSPDIDLREQEALQSWFVDLGVILEIRRIQRDLEESVSRLESLYNRDMLTEIYNRRGIEEHFGTFYDECRKAGCGLAVIILDMDDLKVINDNYGHNEGDYSLKTIADAMLAAAVDGEICARSGGDEFLVIAKDYDEEKVEKYVGRIREYIDKKVKEDGKDYNVVVSVGAHIENPKDTYEDHVQEVLERCLKTADSAMYIEKRQHKNKSNI
ncbi:MAG: GGDEF domain-containing protein [Clostridiales bacterium]|nr:GGDEF domain-containing protein [Clostridiales bacterium]